MRERGVILWFVVIVVLVSLLNLDGPMSQRLKSVLRDVIAPLQQAVASGVRALGDSVQAVRHVGAVVEKNERMAAELVQLRNEVLNLRSFEEENIQLREQLLYRRRADRDLVSCEIIARDMSGWWQTARLDKGYLDGVVPDLAVITPDGLLGRTVESSPRTADVLFISDPSCRVSVRVVRSGVFGILSGLGPPSGGNALCRVEFLNKDASIRAGDTVVTSGLGGILPKGLMIGYVESVQPDESGLDQEARVIARADLAGPTHVFVVVEEEDDVEAALTRRAAEVEVRP